MIKISISGDSSSEVKDKVHMAIVHALGPIAEQYPQDSFSISIRKIRETKAKEEAEAPQSSGAEANGEVQG